MADERRTSQNEPEGPAAAAGTDERSISDVNVPAVPRDRAGYLQAAGRAFKAGMSNEASGAVRLDAAVSGSEDAKAQDAEPRPGASGSGGPGGAVNRCDRQDSRAPDKPFAGKGRNDARLRPSGARLRRKDVYRLYRRAPFGTKLYLRIKLRICPLLGMETHYPQAGRIVDLGCGNGVFSNILKHGAPERDVAGFDLDPKKIAAARTVHGDAPGLSFTEADIAAMDYPEADAYSIVDVLYLIPFEAQERILRGAFSALRPGGVLLLKDMDTRPRWKYRWNAFQETVSVKLVGFTLGSRFYFRSLESWLRLLDAVGFRHIEAVKLDRGQWYPHVLFMATK